MSLPSDKAEEILELCLSNESPQMRAKVYEVIGLSGIKINDPMFLVLALTGQIRVLLEAAPEELRKSLEVWKVALSEGMQDLHAAIAQLKEAQEQQIENIKVNAEEINNKNRNDILNLHRTLVSEILKANTEVEEGIRLSVSEVKQAKKELSEFNAALQKERQTNIQIMKSLIEGLGKTTKDLELSNALVSGSVSALDRLKLSKFVNRWMLLASFISIVIVTSLITLGFVTYTKGSVNSINSEIHSQ